MKHPPSLAYVIQGSGSLYADCPGCRNLTVVDAVAIAVAKGEHVLVSGLKFRCSTCGSAATAHVSMAGNILMGREVWPEWEPPKTEIPLAKNRP